MLGKGKKSIGARNGRCGVQKRFDKDLDAIEKRIPEFFSRARERSLAESALSSKALSSGVMKRSTFLSV